MESLSHSSIASKDLKLAIVLLAAGEGSRLGSVPKALLKVHGKTLLERFYEQVSLLDPIEFLVMTGFHAQAIEAELERLQAMHHLPITIKQNPSPQLGQATTVRIALESLHSDYDALAICLSDQPYVNASLINLLTEQFSKRAASEQIVMPLVHGQRGNPVLFSRQAIKAILASPQMACRPFMDLHPELVRIFETDHNGYIVDIDTAQDLARLGINNQ